jgi:hypothetical protein
MSNPSLPPITLDPPDADAALPPDRSPYEAFKWPTPPFAAYPAATRLTQPEPCEIEGLTGSTTSGKLMLMAPSKGLAHVLVPPSRSALPLRFRQFRRITLTAPLHPLLPAAADPHAKLLDHRPVIEYRLNLPGGGQTSGRTVGHVETDHGLFLFPPADDRGSVLRMFVPRQSYTSIEFGPRLGEMLVGASATTPARIEQAVEEQAKLRKQKLGDILVTKQIVASARRSPRSASSRRPSSTKRSSSRSPTAACRWANCWCARAA